MKKQITILFLAIFSTISATAQIQKHAIVFGTSFNFSLQEEGGEPIPVWNNPTRETTVSSTDKHFLSVSELGYSLSNKDVVGVLFGYGRTVADISEQQHIVDTLTGSRSLVFDIARCTTTTSTNYGVFYRRFIKIGGGFSFSPMVFGTLEKEEWEVESLYYNIISFPGNPEPMTFNSRELSKATLKYGNIGLSGSLVYQIKNWLHIQAKVVSGGIRIHYHDSGVPSNQQRVRTRIDFDANPANWELGVLLVFGNRNKTE